MKKILITGGSGAVGTAFIKEFYISHFNQEDFYKFDRFRQLRNDSVYKAKPVTNEDAKSSVLFAVEFINKVNSLLKSKK